MTARLQIYKCGECGNTVEVVDASSGDLVCCDKPMNLLEEQTADFATEKHVPVITKVDGGYEVVVGSTIHPMTDEHYIVWIQLLVGDAAYTQFLKPGDEPKAFFPVEAENVSARELCNVHKLWKS